MTEIGRQYVSAGGFLVFAASAPSSSAPTTGSIAALIEGHIR